MNETPENQSEQAEPEYRLAAPAKLNLCLYLGPLGDHKLHELVSIFEPLDLEDRVTLTRSERDRVRAPGVVGENTVAKALRLLRSEGWQDGPWLVEIEKRIPVAAGLGGGSADAAAVLRLAVGDVGDITGIALMVGADVPSQLHPRPVLVEGVGQKLVSIPRPADHWVVLLPVEGGLSTGSVFVEAERMGLARSQAELDEISSRLWAVASSGASPLDYPALLVNDLEPAAISLKPEIGLARQRMEQAGAPFVGMTGSGPTVFGLFPDRESAAAAAGEIGPEAILCAGGTWSGAVGDRDDRPGPEAADGREG